MNNLWDAVLQSGAQVVAIVGCSKNAGKTSTLNHILDHCPPDHSPVGLLSIGIDGEESDFWLGLPKPKVFVREGFLVATADRLVHSGSAKMRILQRMGAVTPLGELVIAKVEKAGNIVLAGVRHKQDVSEVLSAMRARKARHVFIDGSYQRWMAADPLVSQGMVLVTGAILGRTVKEVLKKTKDVLERLQTPLEEGEGLGLLDEAVRLGRPVAVDASGQRFEFVGQGPKPFLVAMPGVLSDRHLRAILQYGEPVARVIVTDPTRLFVSAPVYKRYLGKGGKVSVARPIRLIAIAVTPKSILGYSLPAEELKRGIQELAGHHVPVFLIEATLDEEA